MSAVAVGVGLLLGRCLYSLPALLGIVIFLVTLQGAVSSPGLLAAVLALCGVALIAVAVLALVGRSIQEEGLPASCFACVSFGALLIVFQSGVFLDWVQVVLSSASQPGTIVAPALLRIVTTGMYVGAGLSVLLCAVLLVIELPFVFATRLAGVTTPGIVSALKPLALFLAIGMALDLIVAFLLREWPVPVLLAL